jgi:hypothetical protein
MTKPTEKLTNDVLIADTLLRVKAMENILVAKNIFTREEFQAELQQVTEIITKAIMEKSNAATNKDTTKN